jgi:diaminopimelate decarboxylase
MGTLKNQGGSVRYLDLGGGLGIRYKDEEPPHPEEYAKAIVHALSDLDITLILEPGRVIVGNAGILVTEVLYLKETEEKKFVIVDGAMNDLIRPALYGSYQAIRPVVERQAEKIVADVVGPICESGDFFAKDRELQRPHPGDLLAVMSAGAYGFTMSSNYNSRPRAAEVMVDGDRFYVVRQRETLDDLIKGETIPSILQ